MEYPVMSYSKNQFLYLLPKFFVFHYICVGVFLLPQHLHNHWLLSSVCVCIKIGWLMSSVLADSGPWSMKAMRLTLTEPL